jgi:hypothetical protein
MEGEIFLLDIVFSENAAGGLRLAQHYGQGPYTGGCIGVILSGEDDRQPSQEEVLQAQRQAEERERRAWEQAVPLGGDPRDVFAFGLGLDMGDIADGAFSPRRTTFLQRLYGAYPCSDGPDPAVQLVQKAQTTLRQVLDRAAQGEALRLWVAAHPADCCAFCWLMEQLESLDEAPGTLQVVCMPLWRERDGTAVSYVDWGELGPGEWGQFLSLAQELPSPIRHAAAVRWKALQSENAPLRVLLNGHLVSVDADFYDPFLKREIAAAPDEFSEAQVIGRLLGQYQLGIGDLLAAERIEAMIAAGWLEPVSAPDPDAPRYHRRLRKTRHWGEVHPF